MEYTCLIKPSQVNTSPILSLFSMSSYPLQGPPGPPGRDGPKGVKVSYKALPSALSETVLISVSGPNGVQGTSWPYWSCRN